MTGTTEITIIIVTFPYRSADVRGHWDGRGVTRDAHVGRRTHHRVCREEETV